MSYFSKFPKLVYDIKGNGNDALFTHILKRVKLHSAASSNTLLYDTYNVKEGETPEIIAHKLYGDTQLHWIILLINDITDRYHQWPMTVPQFEQFVADKYSNPNGLHHYEISQDSGESTTKINIGQDNTGHPTADSISNYQYEEAQQLLYSQIRLLKSEFLIQFVEEFEDLVNEDTEI